MQKNLKKCTNYALWHPVETSTIQIWRDRLEVRRSAQGPGTKKTKRPARGVADSHPTECLTEPSGRGLSFSLSEWSANGVAITSLTCNGKRCKLTLGSIGITQTDDSYSFQSGCIDLWSAPSQVIKVILTFTITMLPGKLDIILINDFRTIANVGYQVVCPEQASLSPRRHMPEFWVIIIGEC